jgi:N-acetylglucosaminyl-diphospho-decaprenol L-rhamnosyltransferase
MLDLLAKNPSVGAVGPAIRHPTGRLKVLSAGKQPTVWRIFTHATMLSRLSRRIPALEGMNLLLGIHDDRQRDVEWLTGACLLLRRDALDAVGLLTERWFMYAEDFELCLRLHRAGWRLVHLPAARMMHHMGASADPDDAPSTAWAETLHDFYRTDISAGIFADIVWRAVFASQLLSRSMYYLLRARRSPDSDSGGSISRQAWLREARGFAASARAVLRDRDNTVDPQPTCSSVAPGSGIDEFQPTP